MLPPPPRPASTRLIRVADPRSRVSVQLFLHMCDCGIQADAVTCCSLINAMDRAGLWQVAELVLLALCARMPSFRDMRALPALDLSAFLDAPERTLVHTLCLRLSGGEEGLWPDTPSDTPSPLSRLGAAPHTRSQHAGSAVRATARVASAFLAQRGDRNPSLSSCCCMHVQLCVRMSGRVSESAACELGYRPA